MRDIKPTVLVIGAAVTGIPVVKKLYSLGNKIILNDIKDKVELSDYIDLIKDLDIEIITGGHPMELARKCDYIVISPGVPLDIPLIIEAKKLGKEVISEIELAYRLTNTPIVAITGTNGKTTTTSLLGEMMKRSGKKTYVVGNIGDPIISRVGEASLDDLFILEVSSFQLESSIHFRPIVSSILNITPDHLNRHKTMANYIEAKCKIFLNQCSSDYIVLNKDDSETIRLKNLPKSKVLMFSRKSILKEGAFVENGHIRIKVKDKVETIIDLKDVLLLGEHNLENVLAASLMAHCMGVKSDIIAKVLKTFRGVAHRMEYVCEIDGVVYYNDSKGTNPDSSIKAIESLKKPIVLIAGGMDKGLNFNRFVKAFNRRVKSLVLLGETSNIIEIEAKSQGFVNIHKVTDLKKAIYKAKELSEPGDAILLSPACASWDMFKSFEERGELFKEIVQGIRGIDG